MIRKMSFCTIHVFSQTRSLTCLWHCSQSMSHQGNCNGSGNNKMRITTQMVARQTPKNETRLIRTIFDPRLKHLILKKKEKELCSWINNLPILLSFGILCQQLLCKSAVSTMWITIWPKCESTFRNNKRRRCNKKATTAISPLCETCHCLSFRFRCKTFLPPIMEIIIELHAVPRTKTSLHRKQNNLFLLIVNWSPSITIDWQQIRTLKINQILMFVNDFNKKTYETHT